MFKMYIALFVSLLFWASAFVGIRVGLIDYGPGPLALLRFLVASLCMFVINHKLPTKSHIPLPDRLRIGLLGVLGIGVYNVCLNYGEITVSAGVASFLIGLMPAITVVLSVLFFGEKSPANMWWGVVVSLFGLFLIILGEESHQVLDFGVILILIAAVSSSLLNIWQKPFLKKYHPVEVTSWIMWGGTLSLLIFIPGLVSDLPDASWQTTASVVYMGIFPAALAYVAWSYVLQHYTASMASISLYALPVISTVLGFILLGEKPTLIAFIGGLVALFGAVIASRSGTKVT